MSARFYIGSSSNIKKRWNRHLFDLRRNKHHSVKLQRHYNKYKESDLLFTILLECESTNLLKIEQNLLDTNFPYFNNSPTARSNLGSKLSDKTKSEMSKCKTGIKRSDETREKISKGLIGIKVSKETREKMRLNNLGKTLSEKTKRRMSLARIKYLETFK